MKGTSPRFAAWLGTAAVLLHGAPLVLHGVAHAQLGIYLESVLANIYIGVVLYAAPLVAAWLLWTGRIRLGGWLLVGSMVGSLVFEGYHHFLAMSPDHVSQVPAGPWGDTFRITAVASAVTEGLALAAGLVIIARARRAESPPASQGMAPK
jgi:hypothetical protein